MDEKAIAVYSAMSELVGSVSKLCDSIHVYMEESHSRIQRLEGETRHLSDQVDKSKKVLKHIGEAIMEELNEY